LYNDSELLKQLKTEARKNYVSQYNWETEAEKLIEIYRKAFKKRD
jgi:glycosyltransferase involved in cell wall biosynthesis